MHYNTKDFSANAPSLHYKTKGFYMHLSDMYDSLKPVTKGERASTQSLEVLSVNFALRHPLVYRAILKSNTFDWCNFRTLEKPVQEFLESEFGLTNHIRGFGVVPAYMLNGTCRKEIESFMNEYPHNDERKFYINVDRTQKINQVTFKSINFRVYDFSYIYGATEQHIDNNSSENGILFSDNRGISDIRKENKKIEQIIISRSWYKIVIPYPKT